MNPRFNVDDYVKHVETSEVYKVIEVIEGKYQFFYKVETDEKITIANPFAEDVLEIVN